MKSRISGLTVVFLLLLALVSCQKQVVEPQAQATDPFVKSIYSEQPNIVTYQRYLESTQGLNTSGTNPILRTGVSKEIIEQDGLLFKDSNGDGKLDPYEDWRLTPAERATDLVSKMSWNQKLGLLSWGSSRSPETPTRSPSGDEQYFGVPGVEPDGRILNGSFGASIVNNGLRYSNYNLNLDPLVEVKYLNNVQGLVERQPLGIPFFFCSEVSFAFSGAEYDINNPQTNHLSPWPRPMGLGAADDLGITRLFGQTVRDELRMRGRHATWGPMADLGTEPRWSRVSDTIHAEGEVVASHIEVLVNTIQAADADKNVIGVQDGLVVFLKHFPGMGPNEDGMDSHSYPGRNNSYPGNNLDEHLRLFAVCSG